MYIANDYKLNSIDCADCSKKDVCKFIDEFKNIKIKISDINKEYGIGFPFKVYSNCSSYNKDVQTRENNSLLDAFKK